MDNSSKTTSVTTVKSKAEGGNSSYGASYFPWVQIQDSILGTYGYVPPSVVLAGGYHVKVVI